MNGYVAIEDLPITDLPKRFIGNMINDPHGFQLRFNRSEAGQHLISLGRASLPIVVEYLEKTPIPAPEKDRFKERAAWSILLHHIAEVMTGDDVFEKIADYNDFEAWHDWAKQEVAVSAA